MSVGREEADEHMQNHDEVIAGFISCPDLAERRRAAGALIDKGIALGEKGRVGEELAAYDEVVRRFGDETSAEMRDAVGRALWNRAGVLKVDRAAGPEDLLSVYEEILTRLAAAQEIPLQEQAARAMVAKGVALGQIGGRSAEAIAVYDEVVDRWSSASQPRLREQVARALGNKACALSMLGDESAAVQVLDHLLALFDPADDAGVREQVALALHNKADSLFRLDQADDALETLDRLRDEFIADPLPTVRGWAVGGDALRCYILSRLGHHAAALRACDAAIALAEREPEPEQLPVQQAHALALRTKTYTLRQVGEFTAAIAVAEALAARFSTSRDRAIREQVASGLVNRALALERRGDRQEASEAYAKILELFSDDEGPTISAIVAWASNARDRIAHSSITCDD
jgi:tetratricopeptide (TPR) repeat protein